VWCFHADRLRMPLVKIGDGILHQRLYQRHNLTYPGAPLAVPPGTPLRLSSAAVAVEAAASSLAASSSPAGTSGTDARAAGATTGFRRPSIAPSLALMRVTGPGLLGRGRCRDLPDGAARVSRIA